MQIEYKTNVPLEPQAFIDLLNRTSLGERRPLGNAQVVAGMLNNADLIVSAWQNDCLIGIARSVTDFTYCCYLSDLAVDAKFQNRGIGKKLIFHTMQNLAKSCKIILLSAPSAQAYYPKLGFTQHPSAWTLADINKLDL